MGQVEKACVFCGQSCVGQARIKDAKGNYAHKACAAQRKQGQEQGGEAEPLGVDDGLGDGLGAGMDDLWEDLEPVEPEIAGAASGCPGCGTRLEPGTLICMSCGFNTQTGKAMKTQTREAKARKSAIDDDSKIAELGAGVAGLGMKPILPLVGAAIGGLIGAVIWAMIAYFTGFEVGYVAILVGAMCGYGARLGGGAETTGGGMIAGVMAACVAILAIGAGKYVALNMIFDRDFGGNPLAVQTKNIYDLSEEDIFADMAYKLCQQKVDAGEEIAWENLYLPIDIAIWPDDYPASIQDAVVDEWDAMSDRDQMRYRRMISDQNGLHSYRDVDAEWAWQVMADEIATSMIDNGESIDWPNPHIYNDSAVWPYDYPEQIQEQVHSEWGSLSKAQQDTRRQEAVDTHNEYAESMTALSGEFTYRLVIESFKSPLQVLFMVLAIGAAFGIGSNED